MIGIIIEVNDDDCERPLASICYMHTTVTQKMKKKTKHIGYKEF